MMHRSISARLPTPMSVKQPLIAGIVSADPCKECAAGIWFIPIVLQLVLVCGVVITTLVYELVDDHFTSSLDARFVLSSVSASTFDIWQSSFAPSAPTITVSYYVYNITNAAEVDALGFKPHVAEIGPLNYVKLQQKTDISWDPEEAGDVVTFSQYEYYLAADAATVQLEQLTNVFVPNLPLLALLASSTVQLQSGPFMNILEKYGGMNISLFTPRTPREIIFGWNDALLAEVQAAFYPQLPVFFPGLQSNASNPSSGTPRGPNRMYTGQDTEAQQREYLEWIDQEQFQCCQFGPCGFANATSNAVQLWSTPEASYIGGGTGEQFHQFVDPGEVLRVISSHLGAYRHWPITNTGEETSTIQGVDGYVFRFAPGTLGNASINPYEAQAYDIGNGPSGILDQAACSWGVPVYVSLPRFFGATDSTQANTTGLLGCSTQECGTYFVVEPYTGTTIDFNWRLALNVLLQPVHFLDVFTPVTFFSKVPLAYTPLGWVDESSTLSAAAAADIKDSVYVTRDILLGLRWGGIGVVGISLIACIIFLSIAWRRKVMKDRLADFTSAIYFADYYRPMQLSGPQTPESEMRRSSETELVTTEKLRDKR